MFIYVCVDKDRLASFPVYLLHICISVMLSGTSLYCIQLPFWDASILFEIPYKFTSFKVPTYFSVSKLITSIHVYIYMRSIIWLKVFIAHHHLSQCTWQLKPKCREEQPPAFLCLFFFFLHILTTLPFYQLWCSCEAAPNWLSTY